MDPGMMKLWAPSDGEALAAKVQASAAGGARKCEQLPPTERLAEAVFLHRCNRFDNFQCDFDAVNCSGDDSACIACTLTAWIKI